MFSQYGELRPTSGWDRLTGLGHHCKFQLVSRLGSVTARYLVVGVNQTLRRWTEGATYIWQGDHQVGHWPTFLVFIWNSSNLILQFHMTCARFYLRHWRYINHLLPYLYLYILQNTSTIISKHLLQQMPDTDMQLSSDTTTTTTPLFSGWVSWFPLRSSSSTCSRKPLGISGTGFFVGRMCIPPTNHLCQGTVSIW